MDEILNVVTRKTVATDTTGEFVSAFSKGRKVTLAFDYAEPDMHVAAVKALLASLGMVATRITYEYQVPMGCAYTVSAKSIGA